MRGRALFYQNYDKIKEQLKIVFRDYLGNSTWILLILSHREEHESARLA